VPARRLRPREVIRRMQEAADAARASALRAFFKTAPGEYGAGDRFLGLTVPQIRQIAAECLEMPLTDIEVLLESPWHEVRLLGVVLLAAGYPAADATRQEAIYRLCLRRTDRINSWDLVDACAPGVVGAHLRHRSRRVLRTLARSSNLWERRIAIVSTLHFIRHGQYRDTLEIAERLIADREDLIHKAAGWMLREVGKRDEPLLRSFLDRHAPAMPRTMLRYAIERLPPVDRRGYLSMRGTLSRNSRGGAAVSLRAAGRRRS
jgi:3-methyladenine DNA glycosylase AlkD